jgi:YD repeat-containing protein
MFRNHGRRPDQEEASMTRNRPHTVRRCLAAAAAATLAGATAAEANETIAYSYDARGRLVKVERTGSVNNNVTATYAFDKADNRTSVTITGAPDAAGVVVVPRPGGGYRLIPTG